MKRFIIPRDAPNVVVTPVPGRSVQLTNLDKVYFPAAGFTKGDLLQYYANVADVLLPHIRGGKREPLSRDEIEEKFVGNAVYGGWTEQRARAFLPEVHHFFERSVDLVPLRD